MYRVVIRRKKEYKDIQKPKTKKIEDSTVGELKIYNEKQEVIFNCYTLENIGPSTDTPKQDKRIMPRSYSIEWTTTTVSIPKKYKINNEKGKGLLLTCDNIMPNFRQRRILIHIGNYPQDTEGCILLGNKDNLNGTISQSTDAITTFYDIVADRGVDNFTIIIKDVVNG